MVVNNLSGPGPEGMGPKSGDSYTVAHNFDKVNPLGPMSQGDYAATMGLRFLNRSAKLPNWVQSGFRGLHFML